MDQNKQHTHPDQGTLYYKMHWGAYKGHVRGLVRGVVVGSAIGAMIGLSLVGLTAIPAIGAMLGVGSLLGGAGVITAGFAGLGGILASELMGRIGNAAGNVASQLAELELRERYPEAPEIAPDSPEPGVGHHYEVPADRDRGKFFHPRVGAAGALFGGAFGALLGVSGLASHLALGLTAGTGIVAVGVPAAVGILMGASFGVNRSMFKSIFNFTDSLLQGRITGPSAGEKAKDRERYQEAGMSNAPPVITSLQRQEEYHRLQNGYFQKSFEAAFAGNARGLLGGSLSGGLTGFAMGGVAAAAIVALTAASTVVLPFTATAAVLAFTAGGTLFGGMKFFNEASFEAAGHGHVHEVFHERMQSLRKGVDLDFNQAEANIVRRRQADADLTTPGSQEKNWFRPKVALIMAACGALVGGALTPLLGEGILHVLHAASHSHALTSVPMAFNVAAFSMVGGIGFGVGSRVTESLHQFADTIYMGTFFPGDKHPEIKIGGKIPLLSPRSELAGHYQQHLMQKGHLPSIENDTAYHSYRTGPLEAPEQTQQQTEIYPEDRMIDLKPRAYQNILDRGARSLSDQLKENPALSTGAIR